MDSFQIEAGFEDVTRRLQQETTSAVAPAAARLYHLAKRATDIVVSSLAILLLSPLLLLVAVLIKLDSSGPVIFRQERMGYDSRRRQLRTFVMYKYRTMYHNSDQSMHRNYITSVITGGRNTARSRDRNGFIKVTNDPRVTRVGRLLRRWAVDELPQLWNVLKGDMSLVGPRPALPYEVAVYKPHHLARLAATPGCTGLWQVRGWCKLDFEEMVKLDIEYIEKKSFWLDVSILIGTVPAILARHGGG